MLKAIVRGIVMSLTLAQPLLVEALAGDGSILPPVGGAVEPRVEPELWDDGLYRQSWFVQSFLDLKEDHAEARASGRRFAVVFEQRGCIYCTRMHTEVLSQQYINDYVRKNFAILLLDLWGSREVTDFDGARMAEKKLAERWGVHFTPTIVFFKADVGPLTGQWGRSLEVARLPASFGPATFIDLFVWIRARIYEKVPSFQRFHVARMAERQALARGSASGRDKVN